MGVHYFYTWITKRYPLFKKTYDPEIMPAVDNFYLDLNGVLYKCARDDSAIYRDLLKGKALDEIFASVFNYINMLVNKMKPRKRLIIAIDGVAPRAKMNNQRQRRYHSARSNRSHNEFLSTELKSSPGVVSFKNNSISPGTEFMFDLIDRIKFFVQRKIHEDPDWKKLEIIFSGGDVPGEGEHKVMDWMRGWKQSPEYDINESHIIYSNDADLIFLSLSMHLPKMMILREVQNWDDDKTNSATHRSSLDTEVELLYINLLREYMDLEFRQIMLKFTHQYDLERIIDDFILIAFFIGNDFLHQLYCMNAKVGNFDEMILFYKQVVPTLGGYLCDKGYINWPHFTTFLRKISVMEITMIECTLTEMQVSLRETRSSKRILFHKSARAAPVVADDADEGEVMEKPAEEMSEKTEPAEKEEETTLGESDFKQLTKNYELEMQLYYTKIKNEANFIKEVATAYRSLEPEDKPRKKKEFYKRFFGHEDGPELENVFANYAQGLQFVLHYYFHGCPSWTWYYPYSLAPLMSDFVEYLERTTPKFSFELGSPYRPYDQLAYILPRDSLGLLPKAYQEILLSDPRCAKYYPEKLDEFEPFDGVRDYQWIAKLEAFDDTLMAQVLQGIDLDKMSPVEIGRNSHGKELIYKYSNTAEKILVKTLVNGLPDFEEQIEIKPLVRPAFDPNQLSYSQDNVDVNDGFPTLHQLPGLEAELQTVTKRHGSFQKLVLKLYSSAIPKPATLYEGYVFYDFPFKKIGYVNSIITKAQGVENKGFLPSDLVNSILEDGRMTNADNPNKYKTIEHTSLSELKSEKGVELVPSAADGGEVYYALEFRKSAWRTNKDLRGKILYEMDHVHEIYPTSMLQPFSQEVFSKQDTEFKFPRTEADIFKLNIPFVNLFNGDFLTVSDPQPMDDGINIYGDMLRPNNYTSKDIASPEELLEDKWTLIDDAYLKSLGLNGEKDALVLYTLMDSFVVKTDPEMTSSLVLGQLFDIGLKFFKALSSWESKLLVVIDLVK